MVFMAVGDGNSPNPGGILQKVGDIRDNKVDSREVFAGKHHAGIYNGDIAVILQHQHVFPYFTETT